MSTDIEGLSQVQRALPVRTVSYEVVRIHTFWYRVEKVTRYGVGYPDRYEIRNYISLKRAEEHARGLSGGSWSREGPILFSFPAVDSDLG
jgi:hypothetical protein